MAPRRSSPPSIPVVSAIASGPPPVTIIESGSDEDTSDVQSLTIPFRSASSGNFLPMISIEDKWISELEFR